MKLFQSYLFIILTLALIGCAKTDTMVEEPAPSGEFTFQYNNQTYNDANSGGYLNDYFSGTGIVINRNDIFGGPIYFYRAGCAFRVPASISSGIGFGLGPSSCDIYLPGNTDSSEVYYYKSGSVTSAYSNCVHKQGYDIVTGINYEYDLCRLDGTFSLTLENSNHQTIVISNGRFTFHNVIRQ